MSSKITHSKLHKTVQFTRFGMTFTMNLIEETRSKWVRVYRHPDTNIAIDISKSITELEELLGGKQAVLTWEDTGEPHTSSHVVGVLFSDEEDCEKARPVELISTLDGPILGIVFEETSDEIVLLDCCLVRFEKGQISYLPIFNVARKLRLCRTAVRTRQAPSDIIVASYPAYVLQNRMAAYQLKPAEAMAKSVELDTDAEKPVTAEVRH